MSMLSWQRILTIGVCAPPCVAKVRRRRQFEPRRVGLDFVSSTEFSSGLELRPGRYFHHARRRRRQFEPRSSTKATAEFEASQVVSAFYDAYNRRAIPELLELFDQDVVYHDMAVYDDPFVGKAELAAYFDKIERLVPGDIRFVVDDITGSDAKKVGVIWHVELESENEGFVSLPFSRGCSFYELNETGKIIYARDLVEPATKPGPAALGAISAIAPVVRKLGSKADPRNLRSKDGKDLIKAAALYAFAATYVLVVLFSPIPPGSPGIRVDPSDLERIFHESLNFFYVNIALSNIHLSPVPNVPENPVDEGVFNFISAWSLSFLPLMANDPKGTSIGFKAKRNLWIGVMFLTNFFAPWYMARRMVPDVYTTFQTAGGADETPASLKLGGSATKLIAATSLSVGLVSVYWIIAGRPEYGPLEDRVGFFLEMSSNNRVFSAFLLDGFLYSIWQHVLLRDLGAKGWLSRVPLFGLAFWLLEQRTSDDK